MLPLERERNVEEVREREVEPLHLAPEHAHPPHLLVPALAEVEQRLPEDGEERQPRRLVVPGALDLLRQPDEAAHAHVLAAALLLPERARALRELLG